MPPGAAGCALGAAAWCFLTGGIALGSWWAYYELGWGGFWFWDPVENASLLPWLTGTALLHSAIVVEKREALKVWTVLLAIGTFSLSLSGTFLVRSGILNSVHAFANDPARGIFILALLALVIGGSLLLFALRAPVLATVGHFCADLARGRVGAEQHPAVLDRRGGADRHDLSAVRRSARWRADQRWRAVLQRHGVAAGGAAVCRHVGRPGAAVEARGACARRCSRLWWAALAALAVGVARVAACQNLASAGVRRSGLADLRALAEIVERIRLFRMPLADSLARLGGACHARLLARPSPMPARRDDRRHRRHVARRAYDRRCCIRARACSWRATTGRCRSARRAGPNYTARVATIRVSRHGRPVAMFWRRRGGVYPVQQATTTETGSAPTCSATCTPCSARNGTVRRCCGCTRIRWRRGSGSALW